MTVTSYRIYCQSDGCHNEEVIRERDMDDSNWKITDKHAHKGICPACNKAVDLDDDSPYAKDKQEVLFEELDNIGEKGANNLREKGILTYHDVKIASDEEILDTSWVGEKGLASIREEVEHNT